MDDLHTDTTVDRSPIAFPLLAEAKARANAFLGKFDLKEEGYFCFQDRTTLYKSYIKSSMKEDFDEPNSFDSARNTTIEDMHAGIDTLHSFGLRAVRLGVHPVSAAINKNIVDYASQRDAADSFGDIALMNQCKFLLGQTAGFGYSPTPSIALFARSTFSHGLGLIYH